MKKGRGKEGRDEEKIGGMEKNKKEREGRWVVVIRKKRVRGGNDRKGG